MSILNELNYEDTTLPNGLKVLTVSSPHLGLFSAELIIKKGFRDELEHQTQWTHLLEHVLTSNCRMFPDQIVQDEFLTNNGIKTNAYTGMERMAVWGESVPEQARPLLEYLFDSVKSPIITQANIDREAGIINQEHREVFINHDAIFYDLAYRSMIAGTTLENCLGADHYWLKVPTEKELQAFHQQILNAKEMFLIISGPFSHQEVIGLIEPLARDIPGREAKDRIREVPQPTKLAIPPAQSESRIVNIRWPSVTREDKLFPGVTIFRNYLTGTLSSPLNKRLRLDNRLTYGVRSDFWTYSDIGGFSISFKSSKPQEGLALVREVFSQVSIDLRSVDLQEIVKKRMILSNQRSFLTSPNDIVNIISGDYVLTGQIKRLEDYSQMIQETTTDQLLAVADLLSFDKAHIFSDDLTVK